MFAQAEASGGGERPQSAEGRCGREGRPWGETTQALGFKGTLENTIPAMRTKGTLAKHLPPRGSVAQALNACVPMERAHPPPDMASGQDATTTIGPGYQVLPLRSPRPHPVTCHPSPKQLEDILNSNKDSNTPMSKRCRKAERCFEHKERQRMRFLDNESWGRREHERCSEAITG